MEMTETKVCEEAKHATSVLSWSDVTYGVGSGKKSKEILKGISGSLSGGEVCAILGPSGSGKTSLLNVLANRIRHKGAKCRVGGTVTLDGQKLVGSELRKRIAYVMQQDLLFATQTPREAMLFSAMLRLPQSMPLKEKKLLVETMIKDLNLTDCADTYCGDEMIRGISGGEKKRTAVGIELVMKPELIFLDEPTSGLDSYSAAGLCKQLVHLGKSQGCNILCTIHQPASEVFHAFSKAMILYKGKALFYGSIRGLSSGLAATGYGCPAEYNLADHVINVIQTSAIDDLDKLQAKLVEGHYGEGRSNGVEGGGGTPEVSSVPPTEEELTKGTPTNATKTYRLSSKQLANRRGGASAGFFLQLYALTKREAQGVWRDKAGLIASVIAPFALNAIFACIFEGVGDMSRASYNMQGHFGAVAQVLIGGMFGAAQPLLLKFPLERGIFLREYATSTYGAAPYFLSKTLVETARAFQTSCLVWLAFYWIVGCQGPWIYHTLIFWAAGLAAGSTALLVGCIASNAEVAQQAAPPIFVLQLLFAGVFLPVTQIPEALRWIQWIASLKYAINLNILTEFGHATQENRNWDNTTRLMANEFIERQDVDPDLWWLYMIMLVALFCFFRILSIVALARRAKNFY
jgi:ABC-type multidrug transport system ATPase subunit